MNSVKTVRTAQAGTVESMDCLVTVSESDEGRIVEITGSGAARFKDAMEAKINATLDDLEASFKKAGVKVSVQDNGALDIVLGARVEAAYRRFAEVDGI
jgi:citrate lyase subunit gamma (acyl carrier protein)